MTQTFEQLKHKYESALSAIKEQGVRRAHMHIQEGKLVLQGEAPSEQAKNEIWNKVKAVDPTCSDIEFDLTVKPVSARAPQAGATADGGLQTYTVKSGNTLWTIAQQVYGDAGQYMRLYEANRDRLNDPSSIEAGQELYIPVVK